MRDIDCHLFLVIGRNKGSKGLPNGADSRIFCLERQRERLTGFHKYVDYAATELASEIRAMSVRGRSGHAIDLG